MNDPSAAELVTSLGLVSHPEGGWYRETYRAGESIPAAALPARFNGDRSICTAIYYLLEKGQVSKFHRIRSDELWHFYAGTQLTIHIFSPQSGYRTLLLGSDLKNGAVYQAVVPAGCWFGAEVSGEGGYSLVGCTVAPGFDFTDFEMAGREALLMEFPEQDGVIRRLT